MVRRALLVLTALTLVGCGSSGPSPAPTTTGPRPVTASEADRLAVARFNNYRAKGVHVRTSLASAGTTLSVVGDVDYRAAVGSAVITGAGSAFAVQWTTKVLLAWPTSATVPPTTPPTAKATGRALNPTGSDADALLLLLLGLGQNRPDNAQLIAQNGATWVRRDRVDGRPVDVIRGPGAAGSAAAGPVTYWVDATGHLLRVDATFGATGTPTSITLDAAAFVAFAPSTQLGR